jgi:predicted dehydrogenase
MPVRKVYLIFMLNFQAEEIATLAKEKNLFYMEGLWTRFFPAVVKIREMITNGSLGDIKVCKIEVEFTSLSWWQLILVSGDQFTLN